MKFAQAMLALEGFVLSLRYLLENRVASITIAQVDSVGMILLAPMHPWFVASGAAILFMLTIARGG